MKQVLTKRVGELAGAERVWQPGFFDHVMRSSERYAEKWAYMRMNPVRAGLGGCSRCLEVPRGNGHHHLLILLITILIRPLSRD
jgi:hypothetical protein